MRGAMKYFLKKLLSHEIFSSMVSWATKIFFKNLVKPSLPSSYILNAPLHLNIHKKRIFLFHKGAL